VVATADTEAEMVDTVAEAAVVAENTNFLNYIPKTKAPERVFLFCAVRAERIELSTSVLSGQRSTTELRTQVKKLYQNKRFEANVLDGLPFSV
jgi:hypothetical protein